MRTRIGVNRLQPFIKKAWPKSADFILEKTVQNLVLIVIELDQAFAEAVDFIEPLLKPIPELSHLAYRIEGKNLPETQTKDVLKLLGIIFSDQYQYPTEKFRELLDKMVNAEPEIRNDPDYHRLSDFLTEKGL